MATTTLRDRLQQARKKHRYSQVTLAKEIGVSPSTIARIEYEQMTPSVEVALRIARTLDTTVEALFSEEHEGVAS